VREKTMSVQQISHVVRTVLIIAALGIAPAVIAQSGASTLDTAKARMFVGDWTLTVEAGRGLQDRPLRIKDVNGRVAAEIEGGRGGPVTITDITMPAGDLVLKFKQMARGGEIAVLMVLTLKDGGLTVKQTINGMDTTGTGVKGIVRNAAGADARGPRGGPRSGPSEGGTAGTVESVSPSSFLISTPAGVMVTIQMASSATYLKGTSLTSASAITKGESVLVLGTVNLGADTIIVAGQVILQTAGGGSATPSAAGVVPFQRGAPSAEKKVGQVPGNYTPGQGTIVSIAEADKATGPALGAYPGGIVDRVVKLSTGEYEAHNIGVNWPHHIFVNQDFKVIGAE
jgi:hypothetical protein